MINANKNNHEKVLQTEQKRRHKRSELRLFVELFSLATIFFLTSILSLSASLSTKPSEITIFSKTITFLYNQSAFWVTGIIFGSLFLFSLIMIIVPSTARKLGEWIEHSDSKINLVFWMVFMPLISIATVYPVFFCIIDASRGMPTTLGRDITLIVGLFIYLLSVIILILKIHSRLKK
ncbi:MAG: hypothetical protein PHG35_05745 [Dehalococcoidales bacterium]|nr:hypothetical protein [Dehalococcoidales bacterium]